tara:strand:+ start:1384 stop:2286 length:903 start_codon:yes stop_codon:yes gene_type:complete
MKIYNNLKINRKHQNSVIAIGNFDGIHLGHQKVINQARLKAKKTKLPFGIITFEPMPVMFFNKIKNHRINSSTQKESQLEKLKLNFLIVIKFNKIFSKYSAKKFIEEIIYKKTKCKYLFVSNNFKFGFKRKGNIKILKKYEKVFHYKTIITKPMMKKSQVISSTLIRKKITQGKIKETTKLLKRKWCVEGKVIKGQKRGRTMGFPTCNMKLSNYIIPKLGVYAVRVESLNFTRNGIANIGYKPTFNGQNLLLETNIFGFKQNLYNKVIKISFKKFIRPEKKFKNLEHLKRQIKIDVLKAK